MNRLEHLRPDCMNCAGLCCVAPNFSPESGFAYNKPAGEVCRHLRGDNLCDIHDHLEERGFPGCVAYECYGAGQRVTQALFPGRSWRSSKQAARTIFDVFFVVKALHELTAYLLEARGLTQKEEVRRRIDEEIERFDALAGLGAEVLDGFDVDHARTATRELIALAGLNRDLPRRDDPVPLE